jgi:plastocyanin
MLVNRLAPALALALAAAPALAASAVTGTVTYSGKVPSLKPLAMEADPACAAKHSGPVASEVLVLGSGNALANVMVRVKSPVSGAPTAPATPVVIDQNGCRYKPHVVGIQLGQTLKLKNSDGLLHNVHALPKVNTPFNMAMPPTVKESTKSFGKAEGMFQIKCDVHPWMSSYAGVFEHPFFSVTKNDGKFTLVNLEPGTYEITAWHERLGVQKQTVTVAGTETKSINFKFTAPAAK